VTHFDKETIPQGVFRTIVIIYLLSISFSLSLSLAKLVQGIVKNVLRHCVGKLDPAEIVAEKNVQPKISRQLSIAAYDQYFELHEAHERAIESCQTKVNREIS